MRAQPLRLAVLISGRGTNMLAIARACERGSIRARIVLVCADRRDAAGLEAARARGLPAALVERSSFADRAHFERALRERIEAAQAELVVLAGFMRILGREFVEAFGGRMLNIHPSLLPAHKGLDTHRRVLLAGDREHGATVHYVTCDLDSGPLVAQAVVPVLASDDAASLSARVHEVEHMLYPMVIGWIAAGRLELAAEGPRLDGRLLSQPERVSRAA